MNFDRWVSSQLMKALQPGGLLGSLVERAQAGPLLDLQLRRDRKESWATLSDRHCLTLS